MVLLLVVLSALTSVLMIGSIVPFLTVLADPLRIHTTEIYAWAYEFGKFSSDYSFLVALGFGSLITILGTNVIQTVRLYYVTKFATMRMHSLSLRLLNVYIRRPYEYFLDKNSVDLGSGILAEADKVVQLFYRPVAEAIAGAFTGVAIFILLLWINPVVAVVALMVAGGIYLASYVLSRKTVRHYGGIRASANRGRFRIANEALGGVKEIKILGREQSYISTYSPPSLQMATAETMAIFIGTLPLYVMQIVAFGGMIVLVMLLIEPTTLNEGGTLSELLPMLGVFAFGGQRLIPELAKVYTGITQINYGAPVIEAMYRDIEAERTLPALPTLDTIPMGLKHTLELRGVNYSYPNTQKTALGDISFSIRSGERIGIVGGSGAGKSTLADIVMGLLRTTSGEIIVDGSTINDTNIRSWQRSVGYVQQGIFLSDASILENIALGVPIEKIDRARALEAARMARLDDFVSQTLPNGYDTKIGERGVRLSGGQRQRIGIARALYNEADLIVFDEATSALDNITEQQVMESVNSLSGNKTVILIAHRLSTLEKCDRLIVMEHGRVVGVGTWGELIAGNAHFQALLAAPTVTGAKLVCCTA